MPIVLRICPPIQNTSIILADEIRRPIGYWATRRLSLSEGHVSRLVSRPIYRAGSAVYFFRTGAGGSVFSGRPQWAAHDAGPRHPRARRPSHSLLAPIP